MAHRFLVDVGVSRSQSFRGCPGYDRLYWRNVRARLAQMTGRKP